MVAAVVVSVEVAVAVAALAEVVEVAEVASIEAPLKMSSQWQLILTQWKG